MDTITCWRFPHANKAKRRSLFRQACFITSPGLRGNKISFPHETEAENFIWLLAQNDWNETPATGCKGSEKFINSPANVKWRDEVPSTGTSWWLHVTCFCLHRYQGFFYGWEVGTRLNLFLVVVWSGTDDRRAFLQFPEDTISAVKVKLHMLKNMTSSKHCCGPTSIALATMERVACNHLPWLPHWRHSRRKRESRKRVGIL